MDRISPDQARARLRRVRLSQPDHEVLGALLAELGERVELPVERARQVLFAGRTPAAATKAVERLVKLVNTAAAEDGVDLRLEVRGAKKSGARGRLLGFSADRVAPAGDPLREHEAVRDAVIKDRWATLLTTGALPDRGALSTGGDDGYCPLDGRRGSTQPAARRVEVVSFLLDWAGNPEGTPLAALLGEYGTGKTITCQELTERLRRERVGDRPQPLYFDLRGVENLDRGVPTLADILTDCIEYGWASADGPLPSGAEVIAQARTRPTVFVIDGLDEVLVRLDAAQGVRFTHELLKLRPIRTRRGRHASFAGEHTKVLLSCRTHYFRSLREQSRHFGEQDRDLTHAEDYTALVLLPLTQEQIHDYLAKALPDRDATQVMDMLRAVHDLSDLATRPYTLAKVAAQVPFIQRRHAEGRPVHAATIYQQVLRDWLARDQGKHHLRPDHKLTLMARLAAWSWRRGGRRVDSAELDDWLTGQLATDPVLRRRYRDISRDQLEEDLRTATFVIRGDGNGPDRPDFRFAHSSIHEYFLAQYLCDALRHGRRQDWCLPLPSAQTLTFLAQLITDEDDPGALTAELGRWRAPYTAQASELWLRYTLWAGKHGWPHPTPP